MAKFPSPITAENFDLEAKFVTNSLAKAKRKKIIFKIAHPLGGLLFTLFSVLLIFGAIFTYTTEDEMIVFEKLGAVTDIWNKLAGAITSPDMVWYVYWGILIAAWFLVPLAITAVISILVSLFVKGSDTISGETDAEKAKNLNSMAVELSRMDNRSAGDGWKTAFKWLFVILICALLAFAFFALKMLDGSMLIGFAVCAVVLFFVYGLVLRWFYGLNRLFYTIDSPYGLKEATDAYWLSVDPDEKSRREAEKERREKEAADAAERAARLRDIAEAKRVEALEYEQYGNYSLAKQLFKEAAEMGDALAMDNYARHCLIAGNRSEAVRWLQKAVDSGEADADARAILQALKDGKNIDVHYGM